MKYLNQLSEKEILDFLEAHNIHALDDIKDVVKESKKNKLEYYLISCIFEEKENNFEQIKKHISDKTTNTKNDNYHSPIDDYGYIILSDYYARRITNEPSFTSDYYNLVQKDYVDMMAKKFGYENYRNDYHKFFDYDSMDIEK